MSMVEVQPENIIVLQPEAGAMAGEDENHGLAPEAAEVTAPTSEAAHEAEVQQTLQPILTGLEAVARAQFEQVGLLDRVEKAMAQQAGMAKVITDAKQALEHRNVVSRAMFEALHGELKTYKDAFLLEAVLRPVIRDIISLYDDIFEIHRQLALALTSQEQRGAMSGGALMFFETVAAPSNQLEHNRDAILEVLERLDVTLLPSIAGKLDKQTQRAVALEATTDPEQDCDVVKVTKRGFLWKERVIRAEEVVIKRFQDSAQAAAAKVASKN